MGEYVKVKIENRIAVVTLDHPPVNALSPAVLKEIKQEFEALSANDHGGFLGVDTEDRWLMDLQQLPSVEVVTSGLREITPSGRVAL